LKKNSKKMKKMLKINAEENAARKLKKRICFFSRIKFELKK